MKLKYIILLTSYMLSTDCIYAQSIDSLFTHVPQKILPLLDKTSKLDLIDLYNSKLPAKAENIFGGESELLYKSGNYVHLRTSDSGTWSLKVLPLEDKGYLLLGIQSLSAEGVSSTATLYTPNWEKSKYAVPTPHLDQFIKSSQELSTIQYQHVSTLARELPIKITVNDSIDVLTYQLDMDKLPHEDREKIIQYLTPIQYKWLHNRFIECRNSSIL